MIYKNATEIDILWVMSMSTYVIMQYRYGIIEDHGKP